MSQERESERTGINCLDAVPSSQKQAAGFLPPHFVIITNIHDIACSSPISAKYRPLGNNRTESSPRSEQPECSNGHVTAA